MPDVEADRILVESQAERIAEIASPGGNVTIITSLNPELGGKKRLELLKEAVPKLTRVVCERSGQSGQCT